MEDNHRRFSRVVQDYVRYRPSYPPQIIDLLRAECGLSSAQVVADIGSGTGLLTELFLKNGNQVYGVEPNLEMRSAAENFLREYPLFASISATAEATTLADHSIDLVTVGQAFHWFQHDLTRLEFARILVPRGWVVLVWNLGHNTGSPFDIAFMEFCQKYIDVSKFFNSQNERPDYVTRFFEGGHVKEHTLANYQVCDFEALQGRILSSSNAPPPTDPRYPTMLADLKTVFDEHQQGGTVTLEYKTKVSYGQLVV